GRRQVLVDAPLDAPGRVDHGDAEASETMEGVHPEDHLLERAAGDRAHQHGPAVLEPLTLHGQRRKERQSPETADAPGDRNERDLRVTGRRGLGEPRLVPAAPRPEDADLHASPRDRPSSAGSTRPARQTRPVDRLLMVTSAGLNSILSIL